MEEDIYNYLLIVMFRGTPCTYLSWVTQREKCNIAYFSFVSFSVMQASVMDGPTLFFLIFKFEFLKLEKYARKKEFGRHKPAFLPQSRRICHITSEPHKTSSVPCIFTSKQDPNPKMFLPALWARRCTGGAHGSCVPPSLQAYPCIKVNLRICHVIGIEARRIWYFCCFLWHCTS